jgi:hypothetical protein
VIAVGGEFVSERLVAVVARDLTGVFDQFDRDLYDVLIYMLVGALICRQIMAAHSPAWYGPDRCAELSDFGPPRAQATVTGRCTWITVCRTTSRHSGCRCSGHRDPART